MKMDVIITSRNVEVTDWLRKYVEKKIGKLEKFLPNATEAKVELTQEKTRSADTREVVQVTILNDKTVIRAEEKSSDMFAAIDMVVDKLERQIKKYKGKIRTRRRTPSEQSTLSTGPFMEEESQEEAGPRIVRVKQFPVSPMSEEEAIDQMELLGHDFFVFYNANTNSLNVLYRRKDGNYGLLQPELA
jgi:putative sigma-54 modulation protein